MTAPKSALRHSPIHPLHAVFLAGIVPLFLGALFSDIAYAQSYQIQWKNFASWLIPAGLVFAGLALLWTVIDLLRADLRGQRPYTYFLVLLAAWILGFINALVHAKDAWASMPTAVTLSVLVAVLGIAATALGFSTLGTRGVK